MSASMWDKKAVQRNVATLLDDGVQIIGPGEGWLSCRKLGKGRMAEPGDILQAIASKLTH
jgi:phosphopantothenoylcysteine decarboxylase/phosphopantothenate--cysteine ligase